MKHFFTICFLFILCFLFFTGCGQTNENQSNENIKEEDHTATETETTTGVEDNKDDTMKGDDGSLWHFEKDGEVTVTAADGSETVYTYQLTTVTAYLTEKATGDVLEADVEYDDDGSIILFFNDGTAVILTSGQ
jgi:outer membrane lipoprotein-sorting protein